MDNLGFEPSPQLPAWTFRRVVWATLVIVFIGLGFWLLFRFYQVVFILFIAIVMGTVIRPVVSWLHRLGLPRIAGVILVFFVLFCLLVSFLLLLFPLIIEQGATIVSAVPGYYQGFRAWMGNFPNQLIVRLGLFLPSALPGLTPIQQTGQQILASASQALDYIILAVKDPLCVHCHPSFGFSLDTRRPKEHPGIIDADSKKFTEKLQRIDLGHGIQNWLLYCRRKHPLSDHRRYGVDCLPDHWFA